MRVWRSWNTVMGLYRGDLIMEGHGMMGKERENERTYLYRVFRPSSIGFPALLSCTPRRSISEKAAFRPYHCASYSLRPVALVSGSWKEASSFHSVSLRLDGWPAKRSRTEQATRDWGSVSLAEEVGEEAVKTVGGVTTRYSPKRASVLAWDWDILGVVWKVRREEMVVLRAVDLGSCEVRVVEVVLSGRVKAGVRRRVGRGNVSKIVGGSVVGGERRICSLAGVDDATVRL
jgi:hypothetical protein